MAEYSTVVTNIDLKPGIYSASGDQVSKELTMVMARILNKTKTACQTIDKGGWEIASHQIFRLGDHLLVSFLLRS